MLASSSRGSPFGPFELFKRVMMRKPATAAGTPHAINVCAR
jgi:hypothetical protein